MKNNKIERLIKENKIKAPIVFLSTHEFAVLYGVSHVTIIAYCNKGLIKFKKTAGGHRRIALSELERLQGQSETIDKNPVDRHIKKK